MPSKFLPKIKTDKIEQGTYQMKTKKRNQKNLESTLKQTQIVDGKPGTNY